MSIWQAEAIPAGTLLFVNWHHVRLENSGRIPHLHHVTIDRFRAQIAALTALFEFPDPATVADWLTTGRSMSGKYCVLTFDDGLRDHFAHVAPVLEENRLRGLFSINTGPWQERKILSVHKAHLLSAAYSYVELAHDIEAEARKVGVRATISSVADTTAGAQYRYDDIETAKIKFFLNAVIPQSMRGAVLDAVFARRLGAEDEWFDAHYLTPAMVRSLHDRGHSVGMHSHSHLHLASAGREERWRDLERNRASLHDAIPDATIRWISYPYGSPSSINDQVVNESRAIGCSVGLTMRRGVNRCGSTVDPMRLARIDTNDAIGGKSPLPVEDLLR